MKHLLLILLMGFQSWAAESEEEDYSARPRSFVNLIMGIDLDRALPPLPKKYKSDGDCIQKGVAKVVISTEINTLRFIPRGEGECTFLIKDEKGRIIAEFPVNVRKSKMEQVAKEVRALLGDIEGIQIKIINNRVVVDGQILLPSDMNRIVSVIRQFDGLADSIVTVSPLALKKITEFISRDINNPSVTVRSVNGFIILEGEVGAPDEKDRAEKIAKIYLPAKAKDRAVEEGQLKSPIAADYGIINDIIVQAAPPAPPAKTIQVVVHYVELKKDYSRSFDIGWRPSLAENMQVQFRQTAGESAVTELKGTISNLLPKLNWAKSHGHARVLESASIVVQDGKTGSVNSIQQIPYQISGGALSAPSTQNAEVGITTEVVPTVVSNGKDDSGQTINMQLAFSVSSGLPTATGVIVSKNNVKTEIAVRSGQSAAIGGLISNKQGVDYNKVPGGNSNPIINLYASKDFKKDQSQFVVFVTPVIKSSASSGAEKVKEKFRLRE